MSSIQNATVSVETVLVRLDEAVSSAEQAWALTKTISGKAAGLGADGLVARLSGAGDDIGNLLAQISAITAGAKEIQVQAAAITDG